MYAYLGDSGIWSTLDECLTLSHFQRMWILLFGFSIRIFLELVTYSFELQKMSLVGRTLENWRSETDEVKSLSYTRARAKKNSTPFFQMHLSSQNTYHNFTTFTYKYSSCSCVNLLWWPWNGKEIKTYVMDLFLTTHLDYFSIFKLQRRQYKRIKWIWQAFTIKVWTR